MFTNPKWVVYGIVLPHINSPMNMDHSPSPSLPLPAPVVARPVAGPGPATAATAVTAAFGRRLGPEAEMRDLRDPNLCKHITSI